MRLVNFPINDKFWRDTKEGNLYVKLVIIPDRSYTYSITEILKDNLVGDDRRPQPDLDERYAEVSSREEFEALQKAEREWLEFHFPWINADEQFLRFDIYRYISREYAATIVLDSIPWTGYHEEKGYWTCTYEDLTELGKRLYDVLSEIFGRESLHLLTFLDT